eukprot:scaffold42954_cov74-Phaeocystis_antarctica.AAC.16
MARVKDSGLIEVLDDTQCRIRRPGWVIVAQLKRRVDVFDHVSSAWAQERKELREVALLVAIQVGPVLYDDVERRERQQLRNDTLHVRRVGLIADNELDARQGAARVMPGSPLLQEALGIIKRQSLPRRASVVAPLVLGSAHVPLHPFKAV